jgi:hypothetical protein
MFLPFFERLADDLPVSLLGEIRCGSLSEPDGALMRDILMREIIAQGLQAAATAGTAFRSSFRTLWRSTLDLWFLVEPQPLADQTVSLDRVEPTGQPVPRITVRYPTYFGACVERVLGYIAHVGRPVRRVRRCRAAVSRSREFVRALDVGVPLGV